MPASCMTDTVALNATSRIHIPKKWDYFVYFDGPIEVNHMVHWFRIALIVHRDWNDIIVGDRKMSWDPQSASWSVNNWYYKETKQYYVHLMKTIELLRDDELSLQVKIDANVSWPRDDLDPITLGMYWDWDTLWSEFSEWTDDNRIFQWTTWWWVSWWWAEWNQGIRIEYWGPPTPAFNQNFNQAWIPWTNVYTQLNWFVRASVETSTGSVSISCDECSWTFSLDMNSHSHNVISRLPAIPPQAPKYIHFTNDSSGSLNYPWRNTSALVNPNHPVWITEAYSHTWIDANGIVTLLTKAGLDESWCPLDSHYTYIDDQSWFSFWVKRIWWLWPDQVPVYS